MQRRSFITALAAMSVAAPAGGAAALPARTERILFRSYVTQLNVVVLDGLQAELQHAELALEPAPERAFDPASLAVRTGTGDLLGYLPGTHSRILGPLIKEGFQLTPRPVAARSRPRPSLEVDIWLAA